MALLAANPEAFAVLYVFGNGSTYIDGDGLGNRDAQVSVVGNSQVSLQSIRSATVNYTNSFGQPQSYLTKVELTGGGTASYGSIGAQVSSQVIASSSDPGGSFVEARVSLGTVNVRFSETALVQSLTLASGTPVSLTFVVDLSSSFVFTKNPPTPNSDNGVQATYQGSISDSITGSNKGFTIGNGTGGTTPNMVTLTLDTAIGNSISLFADLSVGAIARVRETGTGSQTQITAAINAANTARLVYTPAVGSDVTLIGASGHNYATVPEPGTMLLCVLGGGWLLVRRRISRYCPR